jgi:GT2 family glycosyltransferase/tetratricopeptide (TPR) repeat protein
MKGNAVGRCVACRRGDAQQKGTLMLARFVAWWPHCIRIRGPASSPPPASGIVGHPDRDTPAEDRVAKLISDGDRLRDAGKPTAAAASYGAALSLAPWRTDIMVQFGNMLKDSGRLPEAEKAYRSALENNPDDADVHLQLGHALKLQGRRCAAVAEYRRAAELDPLAAQPVLELSALGEERQRLQVFEAQLRAGGADALLALASDIAAMKDRLDRILRVLPDMQAAVAYPASLYARLREQFDIPSPGTTDIHESIEIILLVDPQTPQILYAQIAGLLEQTHRQWRATVIGADKLGNDVVGRLATSDPRFVWKERSRAGFEVEDELEAALASSADWVLLPATGSVLHPQAFAWITVAGHLADSRAFVFDEDTQTPCRHGVEHSDPIFRQVVDHDTLLEKNVFGESVAIRREVLSEIRENILICSKSAARSSVLLHLASRGDVGHIPFALVSRLPGTLTDSGEEQHKMAVEAHLRRLGIASPLTETSASGPGNISYPSSGKLEYSKNWRITVVIPTRDNIEDLQNFIESLRHHSTNNDLLDIRIINNGESYKEDITKIAKFHNADLMHVNEPFNWSRLNNLAAAKSDSSLIVFANDDMRMLTAGWDDRLRGLLARPDIGIVGPRLLYPDGTVQHAGILFGWKGSVIHDGLFASAEAPGPCHRWHVTRACSAVTGAFLATKRELFISCGGFDEVLLPVAYSDIDYALKVRSTGAKVIWTPSITALHFESKSRGLDHTDPARFARNQAERRVMETRWGDQIDADCSVNPIWHPSILPFRNIFPPSRAQVERHIRACGRPNPWLPS